MKNLVDEITEQVINSLKESDGYTYGVPIGISNRHVHVSKKDLESLFGKGYELTKLKDLSQRGQFAAKETVTLIQGDKRIENVRILGPCRDQTQVEIAQTDARYLKIQAFVRNSGDLVSTPGLTIASPYNQIEISEGCIIASRHLHLSQDDAKRFGLKTDDVVRVKIQSQKSGILHDVVCKVNEKYVLELHLDTDDGNAFLVRSGDIAEIIK